MKQFDVPIIYRSPLITAIKKKRKEEDRLKKDFSPTLLDFGPLQIYLARHFGFCYGVENAIEIAFRTVEENPGKRIFLLSEMIHNPQVNGDLRDHGIRFLQDTRGRQLIPFETLQAGDIVMIPAFGTTLEIEKMLREKGIATEQYDTTCPFVEKVWIRGEAIGKMNYTIIIHGKPQHEETRATFSHIASHSPAVIIRDMEEARKLAAYIRKEIPDETFYQAFRDRYSAGFIPSRDLQRIGVVNQTTMLASDTQAIADYLREVIAETYGPADPVQRFADTRDTLCYATNDNQTAVIRMLEEVADLAIVVGGYNSSNTSHLVELCEEKLPTYFINNEDHILSRQKIIHYDFQEKTEKVSRDWLPMREPVRVLLTSGASCPDALVEGVIEKLRGLFPGTKTLEEKRKEFS